MVELRVTLDTRQFEALLNNAAEQIPRAMRAVITKAARDARRTALGVTARDADESAARAKAGVPNVSAARATNLTATWTIPKVRVNATDTLEVGTAIRKGPVAMGVERLSGGRSSNLSLSRGFILRGKNSGKPLLFSRSGKGSHGTMIGTRQIFGEMTRTGMSQEDGAPRLAWEKEAEAQMKSRTAEAVQAALNGSRAVPSEGAD